MSEKRSLIAASHGTDSAAGAQAITALVDAVRMRLLGRATVVETYVDVQHPQVDEVLEREFELRPNDTFTVVPLLLSTGYHVRQDIAEAAYKTAAEVNITPALGPDQRLVAVLVKRLVEVGVSATDTIVLCAAGSSDARAVAEVQNVKALLDATLGSTFNCQIVTELAFLSAAEPKLETLVSQLKASEPAQRITVATYLLAPGFFADKTKSAGADLTSEPLLTTADTPDQIVEIVVERFENAAKRAGQTGCLDGLYNRPFAACAAGCETNSCRKA